MAISLEETIVFIPQEVKMYHLIFQAYDNREQQYQGQTTQKRAVETFEFWKKLREEVVKKKGSEEKLLQTTDRREIVVPCDSLKTAMKFVKELLDTVPNSDSDRNYNTPIIGIFRQLIKQGHQSIATGFSTEAVFSPRPSLENAYYRFFYIDYDPNNPPKGFHYNVVVQPSRQKNPDNTWSYHSKHDYHSLKVAFTFPYPQLSTSITYPCAQLINLAFQLDPYLLEDEFLPHNFLLKPPEELSLKAHGMILALSEQKISFTDLTSIKRK